MKAQILALMISIFSVTIANAQATDPAVSENSRQEIKLPGYLEAYMKLKDALFSGDASKVKSAASDMKSKMAKAEISDSKKVESISSSLTSIASMDDIEAQRVVFAKLSQYMITYLENNPVPGVTLYSDYCPMARDGKGAYWVSTDKMINNNPYMGEKMPHCGTIDQKIAK